MEGIEDTLFFYNPWWTKKIPGYLVKDYRREAYGRVKEHLKLDRIVIIKGPRRVGKTTLMYQLIDELLKQVTAERILYVSFDGKKLADLDAILETYQRKILKAPLDADTAYIFLDEVQYLTDWQTMVKKYFDRSFPLKFIISGSSATLIKKGSESLMGRTIDEVMLPFSFREYVEYHTKRQIGIGETPNLAEVKRIETDARILFEEYLLKGGFPNIFDVRETELWQKMVKEDITDKAIYRDITALYKIKKPEALEKLFYYLTGIHGRILNASNISQSIGLSREYVNEYLTYLKNAYFVHTLRKYSGSVEKTVRSSEKAYILDPAIVNSFLNRTRITDENAGTIVEGLVAEHLRHYETYYWRDYYEVDFILKKDGSLTPIEVKYKNTVDKEDMKGIFNFMERFNAKEGIVVTKDRLETTEDKGHMIRYIPAWLFLLTYRP